MQQRSVPSEVIMRSTGQFVPLPTNVDLATIELHPLSTTAASQNLIRLQIALNPRAPCSVENFVSFCLPASLRRPRPDTVPRAFAALSYEGLHASFLSPKAIIAFPDPAAPTGADSSSFFGPFFRVEDKALRPLDRAGLVCVATRPFSDSIPGGECVSDILSPFAASPPPANALQSLRRFVDEPKVCFDALVARVAAGRAAAAAEAADAAAHAALGDSKHPSAPDSSSHSASTAPTDPHQPHPPRATMGEAVITPATSPSTALPAGTAAPSARVGVVPMYGGQAAHSNTSAPSAPSSRPVPLTTRGGKSAIGRGAQVHVATSAFFVTLGAVETAFPHVVVGEVVRGLDELLARTSAAAVGKNGHPSPPILLKNCGLARPRVYSAPDTVVSQEAHYVHTLLLAADALDAIRPAAEGEVYRREAQAKADRDAEDDAEGGVGEAGRHDTHDVEMGRGGGKEVAGGGRSDAGVGGGMALNGHSPAASGRGSGGGVGEVRSDDGGNSEPLKRPRQGANGAAGGEGQEGEGARDAGIRKRSGGASVVAGHGSCVLEIASSVSTKVAKRLRRGQASDFA